MKMLLKRQNALRALAAMLPPQENRAHKILAGEIFFLQKVAEKLARSLLRES